MRKDQRRCLLICVACLAGLSLADLVADEPSRDEFVLRESLGQTWRNECVRFELTAAQLAHAKAGHALVAEGQSAIAYQLEQSKDQEKPRIAFAADLNPFEERRYRFTNAIAKNLPTGLVIEEPAEYVTLRNSRTGISLRRKLKAGQGPVAGMQLADGGWIGDSRLRTTQTKLDYSVEVTARGPVFTEAVCRLKFGDEQRWEIRFRLDANEPVVVIDETFSTGDDAAFLLALGTDFAPDRLFYRTGNNVVGNNATWNIDSNDQHPVFVLEPWLRWWERDRQGNWFGLYSSTGSNLVALGALEPGLWIDPAMPAEKRSAAQIFVTQADNDLWATFPLRGGCRKWMIATLDQDLGLAMPPPPPMIRGFQPPTRVAPQPQRYLIKHGDFPLDRIKDATSPWTDTPTDRARAASFVSDTNLKEFRRRFHPDPDLLAQLRRNPIVEHAMDEPIAYYFATQDDELGRHLASEAVRLVQTEVDNLYQQNYGSTLGVEPHRRAGNLLPAINMAALMLGTKHLSEEQSRRLKSQLAFLADTVTRPDFHSPARGYSANPNMTSQVVAFQVRIAGAIPSHPKAAAWMTGGMNELKRELEQWSDDNGGWLEAPHYAVVAYDVLLGCFLAAQQAGLDDVLYHPRMKKFAEWLAKISTPPDPRLNGRRHLPPIGNTYQQEPTSIFGHLSVLWRERDPQFAANMQWMHRQHGSPTVPGIGGGYPTLAGFRTLLLDADLPAAAPDWKSELFPEAGVILRSGFPSDRETQLSLIAGRLHDHYDDDSGSITLWGKGSLLASDFGYEGTGSIEDHSLVISPTSRKGVMRVEEFATTEQFDTVRGTRDGWTRQIAFVKDSDPLAAQYFVIRDSLGEAGPMKWQLWLTAEEVTLKPQAAAVRGQDDVDLDVVFTTPQKVALRTEEKSRRCGAMRPNGSFDGNHLVTQTGLIAEVPSGNRITAVLYPRLKTEAPPKISVLSDGNVIRIETSAGTDYVFLGSTPFTFHEKDISFEGTTGVIQLREKSLVLALGASGKIAARKHELRAEHAESKSWVLKP